MTTNNLYIKAKEEMLTASSDDCQHFFVENNCTLELAYWELLHNNPQKATELFITLSDKDIRARWGAFLSQLVQEKVNGYPSYFQLRNFFEIDLNLLFNYYLGDYIQNIVKYLDWLYTINPEVYKFTGRVFLKNGYEDYGLFFLNRAKDYFFNDPELHFLLAEYYITQKDFEKAKKSVKNCLEVLPGYYPAIMLQEKYKLNCQE